MTLFFGWNNTSSRIYLWRATLAFCFARLDSRTPNTGSQLLWLPSLPFFCSMTLSGKTHPAQVTRVLHSTPSVGVQLPQFLKKHLTWYYFQTEHTFCRRGLPALVHFQLFSCSEAEEMLRDPRAAAPHRWVWKSGGREGCKRVRRVARLRPSFQSMRYQCVDLSCTLANTPSPGALPAPSQLAPLRWPGRRASHLHR